MSGCHDTNEPSYTFQLRQEINAWKLGMEQALTCNLKNIQLLRDQVNTFMERLEPVEDFEKKVRVPMQLWSEKVDERLAQLEMTMKANSSRLFTERYTYGKMLDEKIIERVAHLESIVSVNPEDEKENQDEHEYKFKLTVPNVESVTFDNMSEVLHFFATKHNTTKFPLEKQFHPSRQHLEKKLHDKNLLIKELEAKLGEKTEKLNKAIHDLNNAIINDRTSRKKCNELEVEFTRRSENQALSLRQMQDKINKLETALKGFLTVDPKEFTYATEKGQVEKVDIKEHRYGSESREAS